MSLTFLIMFDTMKKLLFLPVFFLFFTQQIGAQSWAPIGAEWYYTERFFGSDGVDFFKFTSEKDTLYQGELCKKLLKRHYVACSDRPTDCEFTFERNDTIFFWDPNFNAFQILYDFNATPGSQWVIRLKDHMNPTDEDSVVVRIDSETTILINGITLKKWAVTYMPLFESASGMTYTSEIIENIGDTWDLFNFFPEFALACDFNFSQGLRCYIDSYVGTYSTGFPETCDYVSTGVAQLGDPALIRSYPNPVITDLLIDVSQLPAGVKHISITDIQGRVVASSNEVLEKATFDLSGLSKGIYVGRISDHQNVYILKLVKE